MSPTQFLLSFHLGMNWLIGEFESIFTKMPKYLINLNLAYNNYIKGEFLDGIARSLPILSILELFRSSLGGKIRDSIGDLIYLIVLRIGDTRVEGPIPPSISKLKNLRFLDFQALGLKGDV